jgi:putative peptidoglycan lipid II flippase
MGVAVFISRLLGLVREQVFAAVFGATWVADAYIVAFRIPNLFRDLFAEGALSASFVSVFSKLDDQKRAERLASHVMGALSIMVLIVCLAIFFSSEIWVKLLASSFQLEPQKFELTVRLTKILSPFLFFVSSAALAMGVLNSRGVFFVPSMGAAAFNLGNILVGGLGAGIMIRHIGPEGAIQVFCIGTLFGAVLQWVVQWPSLMSRGFKPWAGLFSLVNPMRLKAAFTDPLLKKIFYIMAPSVLTVAAMQINVMVNTTFAAGLGDGPVSWLNYAYRILHFPMGVFGVSLATAALPELSRLVGLGQKTEFSRKLENAVSWSLILAVGSSVGFWILGDSIVRVLYQYGRFTPQDTIATADALRAYGVGLAAFSLTKIFAQGFYALEMVWVPSIFSLCAIALNYMGNLYFSEIYGHMGLAFSTSLVSWVNALGLGLCLFFMGYRWTGLQVARAMLGCIVAGLALIALKHYGLIDQLLTLGSHSRWADLALVLAVCGLCGILFLAIVSVLSPEGRALFKRLKTRLLP